MSRAVSKWSRPLGCRGFRGVFWVGRIFSCFFSFLFVFSFFIERTRPAASMRTSCLIHLSTSKCTAVRCCTTYAEYAFVYICHVFRLLLLCVAILLFNGSCSCRPAACCCRSSSCAGRQNLFFVHAIGSQCFLSLRSNAISVWYYPWQYSVKFTASISLHPC